MNSQIFERFNINISGTGRKTMMFAHGLGCDQTMWRFITPAFTNEYKIVLFDYLGSGNSDVKAYKKENYTSLGNYADDILDIINDLNLTDVIFVGHSVGCMVGMLAAIKAPHAFEKVIMIGPSPCYINFPGYNGGFYIREIELLLEKLRHNLQQWSETFAPAVMANSDRPELSNELKESFLSTNHNNLYHFAELTFKSDLRSDVMTLKIPTIIMQCSEDIIAPEEVGEFMHQNISGSKLVKMQATGHCAHLSEPGETIALIKEYLGDK